VDEWPSRGHRLLFGDLPVRPPIPPKGKNPNPRFPVAWDVASNNPQADAHRLLPGFLSQAFRRPVSPEQVAPYLALFQTEWDQGANFREAMLAAATAALCAPDFLYLRESPGRLDAYALASRLSYFLIRSMPDEILSARAADQSLLQPEVLRNETERLLRHPNSVRMIHDFTDSWLNLREIDFTTPDKQLYPEFDGLLQDSMLRETRSYFQELLANNLLVTNFVQSDFAMLNQRLAEHYGIPGVAGNAIRRVELPAKSHRGGFLTQGAVLKVSANGTNSSPVVRGIYVLERFLGTVPPPPPPGVPAVEPDIRGAKTVRELLTKHRSTETCAGCHQLIDPPGFALEEYDVIGGYRTKFRALIVPGERGAIPGTRYKLGQPVDSAGELTTGERFQNFSEFQNLLVRDPIRLAECFTEKLLTFGTGHAPNQAERAAVAKLVHAPTGSHLRTRDLIHAVVLSDLFRSK
jgi:hypothetical protein